MFRYYGKKEKRITRSILFISILSVLIHFNTWHNFLTQKYFSINIQISSRRIKNLIVAPSIQYNFRSIEFTCNFFFASLFVSRYRSNPCVYHIYFPHGRKIGKFSFNSQTPNPNVLSSHIFSHLVF